MRMQRIYTNYVDCNSIILIPDHLHHFMLFMLWKYLIPVN